MPRNPHPKPPRHALESYKRDPLEALPALERDLRGLMDERLQPLGLTLSDSRVLRFIVRPVDVDNGQVHGQVRARDIERFFELAQRSVQDTLQRLVDAKFVVRVPDPRDRRAKLLEPTALGRKAHARACDILRVSYDDILEKLSNRQAWDLAGLLFRLRVRARQLRRGDSGRKR